MATTKYQVLARYFNTQTNNAVTNSESNNYERAFGFYTTDHSGEIAEIIMEGNHPQNVKNDMLFAYAGTKKVYPTDTEKFDEVNQWPYMIIDVYERVWFSPWFAVHTCGSLASALEKAKLIVNAIGIDNVKIIKLVSIDQYIKIK